MHPTTREGNAGVRQGLLHVLGYGWIVKNHRIRKSVGATTYYPLIYAGIKEGHHTIYGAVV